MENEHVPPTSGSSSSSSTTTPTTSSTVTSSSSSSGRQPVPQISVYSGIPDRQTVQVIQQALHRQPNTAAQYLQQMYAAQQQHLMLQTAALQQQHLSSAQLQSLAAVQQASLAANRQGSNQNGSVSQQSGASQTTLNLATSPAAAQLISRAQSVNSAASGIAQQAVLLGNSSTTGLTASQAQMYLRAQMAQQSNLVQVARSLGRAVPLSPQLIFTPTATVTAVQQEVSNQSSGQQTASSQSHNPFFQVQNLALRSQQGPASASPSQSQLQSLGLKPAPGSQAAPPAGSAASQPKAPGQGALTLVGKGASCEASSEGGKKGESPASLETRVVTVSRNVTPVCSHPLITPAYTQIQPHQLIQQQHIQQQHKQIQQHQFVIQQQQQQQPQPNIPQRSQPHLLHCASIQPQPVQTLTIQPTVQPQTQQCTIPVLPKQHITPSPQATIFHSTLGPQTVAHNGQPSALSQAQQSTQPVQVAAVNLQIQPVPSTPPRLVHDGASKEKVTPVTAREPIRTSSVQQPFSTPSPTATTTEPHKPDASKPATQGKAQERGVHVKAGGASAPAMTSGNGNGTSTVAGSAPQNGENKPPQAIVKPQILTHVIEGFVIQEGAEPFPVVRPPLLIENLKKQKQQLQSDPEKIPHSNRPNTTDSEMEDLTQQDLKDQEEEEEEDAPKLKCELCGRVDFAYKFKRSKRFCSMACAKRYNVGCTKRVGLFHPDRSKSTPKSDGPKHRRRRSRKSSLQHLNKEAQKQPAKLQSLGGPVSSPLPSNPSQESSQGSDISSYEEPPSPLSAASSIAAPGRQGPAGRELPLLTQHFLPSDPTKWNVEEVYEFIRSLPGCQEIADEFRSQEIDGQAMLLLKEDHLMSAMNIKLGPALKIYARICLLKDS
ncbi:polyhomeotic-like protein 2 isoform X2 [Acipenser ruthenus]|uniref:polyhomeotic-like protein 2 isoform X2 n=1 Tax=Acipenser ruthenus TaxID=7906 RepID=UPI0027427746|nr:polyhomeotic-like protein 2 isoform X2 [Acipenser ruthenus]